MRFFYLLKPNLEKIKFYSMKTMIQFCDKYAGVYSQYIFTIPLIGYVRVDPLPDIMDPVVRKKYELKEIVERVVPVADEQASEMVES